MRIRAWAVSSAFLLAIAGCGSTSTTQSEAPPEKAPQTIDPATATTLKFGDTLDVVADLPRTVGGDPVYFESFTPDGKLLGSATPQELHPAQGPVTTQSRPILYDLDSKEFTVLDDGPRPQPTWVSNVRGTEKSVVWVEGSTTSIGVLDFAIYSYDRTSKKVTKIAEFSADDGETPFGDDLDVVGSTAYFSTLTGPVQNRTDAAVYSVPVDGSQPPSVLVTGGAAIEVNGNTLTYEDWSTPRDDALTKALFSRDLRTGETTPVPVDANASDPGFCGAEITESFETSCMSDGTGDFDYPDAVLTIKESSGRTSVFKPFPTDSFNGLEPHDVIALGPWTGITMTTDDGQDRKFLVDLETKEVKVFPDNTSFSALSPDQSMVLVSSYEGKGPGLQRIVRIPEV